MSAARTTSTREHIAVSTGGLASWAHGRHATAALQQARGLVHAVVVVVVIVGARCGERGSVVTVMSVILEFAPYLLRLREGAPALKVSGCLGGRWGRGGGGCVVWIVMIRLRGLGVGGVNEADTGGERGG